MQTHMHDETTEIKPEDFAHLARTASGHFPYTPTITPDDIAHANRASTQMLLALGALGKPMYGGTVDPVTVAHRRRRNKAARIARRAHRR